MKNANLKRAMSVVFVIGLVSWTVSTSAETFVFQPDEASSQDVFTYQFAGAGFSISPSAADQNLDTDSLLSTGSPIGQFLGTSRSETTTHLLDAGGNIVETGGTPTDTGHDGFSWIKFDTGGLDVSANDVTSAKLRLWSVDGLAITGAFANPSPTEPVQTEVFAAGGPWNEQVLKWTNQDPFLPGGPVLDSVTQTGVEEWVEFDVTGQVQAWLDGQVANDGFFLSQTGIVSSAVGTGGQTGVVSSLYASSAWSDSTLAPTLVIDAVPEPSTSILMGVAALGVVAIGRRYRRKPATLQS